MNVSADIVLPVYQYPTLTILIDDSASFLDSLEMQLPQNLHIKAFSDSRLAMAWLRKESRFGGAEKLPIRIAYDDADLSFDQRTIAIDFGQIYHQVVNPHRFSVPSVLIVDYAMPQMDGISFFKAIQDLPCKKVLLTGEADESMVIEAFNQGLIDRFYKKNDNRSFARLAAEIDQLHRQFFIAQSRTLKDLLIRDCFAFLSDPEMVILVEQLCSRFKFIEHYVFPNPAGLLFLDTRGKATLLVVETDASMQSHVEVAQASGGPAELLCALNERQVVPFFADTGGMYTDAIGAGWLAYCLPAETCFGRQRYYWALFDMPSQLLPSPLCSYSEFRSTQKTAPYR